MSRREKIIVGLMFVAIAFGAYLLLGGGRPQTPGAAKAPTADASDLAGYIAAVNLKIEALDKKGRDLYALAKAGSAWTHDPFLRSTLPAETRANAKSDATGTETPMRYTGFIEIAGRRLAVINGLEYGPGERIDASGHTVKDIGPTHVRLIGAAGGAEIRVALEEGGAAGEVTREE